MIRRIKEVAQEYYLTPKGSIREIQHPLTQFSLVDEITPVALPDFVENQTYELSLGQILNLMVNYQEITPDYGVRGYQRDPLPRTIKQRMDDMLLGANMPVIYLALQKSGPPHILDGQQRSIGKLFAGDGKGVTRLRFLAVRLKDEEAERAFYIAQRKAATIKERDVAVQGQGPLFDYLREGVVNPEHQWYPILQNLDPAQCQILLASYHMGVPTDSKTVKMRDKFKKAHATGYPDFKPSEGDDLALFLKTWGHSKNPTPGQKHKGIPVSAPGLQPSNAKAVTAVAIKAIKKNPHGRIHERRAHWFKVMPKVNWTVLEEKFAGTKGANYSKAIEWPLIQQWNKYLDADAFLS